MPKHPCAAFTTAELACLRMEKQTFTPIIMNQKYLSSPSTLLSRPLILCKQEFKKLCWGQIHCFQYGARVTFVYCFPLAPLTMSCPPKGTSLGKAKGPSCSRSSSAYSAEPAGNMPVKMLCADSSLLNAAHLHAEKSSSTTQVT